jgi:hypothetical protein
VYGNRAGYDQVGRKIETRIRLPAFGQVHPDEDVQRIQTIERLNMNLLDKLNGVLRLRRGPDDAVPLDAYGQTPLYLALTLCFQEGDFGRANKEDPKRIVVITDGENQQREEGKKTKVQKVLQARRGMGLVDVPIDIIGLGLDTPDTLKRELRNLRGKAPPANKMVELYWLAEQTGGVYYSADEKTLGESLRAALGLVRYSVQTDRDRPGADQLPRELGEPWPVEGLLEKPARCRVQLHGVDPAPDEQLRLEGGEKVVLVYDKMHNQLQYPEYRPPDARGIIDEVQGKSSGTRYRVQALMPRPVAGEPGVWDFCVYVQQQSIATDEYRFTPRPKHVWAEVQPTSRRRDVAAAYMFFHRDFLEDQPVPVFRFRAQDWPKQADRAIIRLSFAVDQHDVTPDVSRPVSTVAEEEFVAREIPGATLKVRAVPLEGKFRYRVLVTETHPSSAVREPIRVQLYPRAGRISRRDFIGVNVIQHQFDYRTPESAMLQLTSRQTIQDGAIHVQPLEVTLPPR